METLPPTPSQTVGPFFAYSLTAGQYGYPYSSIMGHALLGPDAPGSRIQIMGQVLDGQGVPVPDAVVELWQADPSGRYRAEAIPKPGTDEGAFVGFGRVGTGTQTGATFRFETLRPGAVGDGQAPHINVILFMRGSLRALYTRLYFSDEPAANALDELLNAVPADRRNTLIANEINTATGTGYRFDIRLQGDDETVFFDL